MKRIICLLVVFVWLLCISSKCSKEDGHSKINVINNSSATLFVSHAYDTLIPSMVASYNSNKNSFAVNPYESKQIHVASRHGIIETDGRINPYLYLFVVDMQVLETYSFNTIKNDYMILQRYDVTVSDLQRLDWQITYPPNEKMKDIKMYPPYGQ